MKSPTLGLRVASVIFGLMGLGHLTRIVLGLWVQVGNYSMGRRWSAVAFIVLAALCAWMWMLAAQAAKPKTEVPPAKPAA